MDGNINKDLNSVEMIMTPCIKPAANSSKKNRDFYRSFFGITFIILLISVPLWMPFAWVVGKAQKNYMSVDQNYCRTRLTPKVVPGFFWQKHRNYLVSETPYHGDGDYVVLDENTGIYYYWDFQDNIDGHGHFWVLTRFTWFYPQWENTTWLLIYKCTNH